MMATCLSSALRRHEQDCPHRRHPHPHSQPEHHFSTSPQASWRSHGRGTSIATDREQPGYSSTGASVGDLRPGRPGRAASEDAANGSLSPPRLVHTTGKQWPRPSPAVGRQAAPAEGACSRRTTPSGSRTTSDGLSQRDLYGGSYSEESFCCESRTRSGGWAKRDSRPLQITYCIRIHVLAKSFR